jgi:hypothetical protein
MEHLQWHSEHLDGWWHARFDDAARWQEEELASPSTPIGQIVSHEPTMGWRHLEDEMESLRIPGSWEASRPGYRGVAWHWRPLVVPGEWQAQRVHLCFGGARLRTEVYLDEQLVGYDLDGATPFAVEIGPYVRPDCRHELALRVTHPGGWRDARHMTPLRWAGHELPSSPDTGGVWGGVTLLGRPDPCLLGLSVFPQDDGSLKVRVQVDYQGTGSGTEAAWLRVRVFDREQNLMGDAEQALSLSRPDCRTFELALLPTVKDWTPEAPALYRVQVRLSALDATPMAGSDQIEVWTGLRTVGLGDNGLRLQGRRRRLCAALTAGWYPDERRLPALAEEEARVARGLGLDGLAAWHAPLRPELLNAADRHGLLLVQTLGLYDPAYDDTLYAALARQRMERLVRRDGAHPSLVAWHLGTFSHSPSQRSPERLDVEMRDASGTFGREVSSTLVEWLALMRRLDPSRPILWGAGAGRLLGLDPRSEREVCLVLGERRCWPGGVVEGVQRGRDARAPVVCVDVPDAMPNLPDLAAQYGDRGVPGSEADIWRRWRDALQTQFDAYGLDRYFPDLSSFCRATWMSMQGEASDTLQRVLDDCAPESAVVLLRSWSGASKMDGVGYDVGSLVNPFRQPKIRALLVKGCCLQDGNAQSRNNEEHDSLWLKGVGALQEIRYGLGEEPASRRIVLLLGDDDPQETASALSHWLGTPIAPLTPEEDAPLWLFDLRRASDGAGASGIVRMPTPRYLLGAVEGDGPPYAPLVIGCTVPSGPAGEPRLGVALGRALVDGCEVWLSTLPRKGLDEMSKQGWGR